jgi:alanine-glyoxylate transaminase/serine-glyoxylate transaminase/serine-pyruvate transaminase
MLGNAEEDKLLLIPGPTPVTREILAALAQPTISHTSKHIAEIFGSALEMLRVIADNQSGPTFVFSGSGTLAQEAAILNFVEPSDRLLVASNGYFSRRLGEIAGAHDLPVTVIEATPGTSVSPEDLRVAMRESRATVVAFAHVETSTGAMAPLADLVRVTRDEGALSIVDGVAAFGGVPEEMDGMGIDVLLTGSQKALGVPPGLAIVFANSRAWTKRLDRKAGVDTFYADLARWYPVMESPDRYFSTHPINHIYALEKALRIVTEEGLPARYERHVMLGESFRRAMLEMGFEPLTDSDFLSPTLSALKTPAGLKSSSFRARMHQNGVVAAGGLNDPDDRIVRFGHMGNITSAEIAVALAAVRSSL